MSHPKSNSSLTKKHINPRVAPGQDFYEYAVGGWIKKNPIPATEARWGTFDVLIEKSRKELHAIAQRVAKMRSAKPGSDEQLVRDLWLSGMDEKRRNTLAWAPIEPYLERITALATKDDVLQFIYDAHVDGIDALWGPYVGRDDKNSNRNVLHLVQSGISLPDRDYYLKDDDDSKKVRAAYREYITKLWKLAKQKNAASAVETILSIETKLAEASMTRVERRDPDLQYNPRNIKELQAESPAVAWSEYFKVIFARDIKEVIVAQPKFLARVSDLLNTVSVDEWKVYLTWKVLDGSAGMLHEKAVKTRFAFYGTALSGTKKMKPLWKRMVGTVDGTVGDALGKLYVQEHFNAQARRRIDTLVDNLFVVYKERIQELDWMSPETKKKALVKLSQMKRKLAHPRKWKSYKGIVFSKDDFVGNLTRAHAFEFKRMMKKLKEKPDPEEWFMTAPTVNAYFHPNFNEIVFPAGIMQPPFFDAAADDAVNYGGIGSVIGHEITHGFDDEGRKFDGKGNLKNWWTEDDAERFKKKAQILVDQYNGFEIVGMHVNGELTLGENIADLGGVVMALEAYKRTPEYKKNKMVDGFTPIQRFFMSYAMTEAGSMRVEAQKKRIVTDPHSPSKFRVNGPLAHIPEFFEAFGVKETDALYRSEDERARIW